MVCFRCLISVIIFGTLFVCFISKKLFVAIHLLIINLFIYFISISIAFNKRKKKEKYMYVLNKIYKFFTGV